MDGHHCQTLEAIFAEPIPAIEWEAIEDLLILIGCSVLRDEDERVTFELDGSIGSFERPPGYKPTRRYVVRAVRDYLIGLGATP